MKVRLIEGFDPYPTVSGVLGVESRWIVNGGSGLTLTGGRFGGQCIRNSAAGAAISAAFLGAPLRIGSVGVAYQTVSSASALSQFMSIRDTNNDVQFTLAVDQLGRMFAYRGNMTTFLVQASVTLTVGVWYYIEVEYSIDTGAGYLRVFVNGSPIINFTGNTQGIAGVNTSARVGLFGSGVSGHLMSFDDIYVSDRATRFGECRVEPLRPNGDTATKGFTPNAGVDNYARVNEVLTDGDTSYVYSSLVGAEDLYDIDNLSVTPQNIFAVQTRVVARKDDVATRVIQAGLKSGATTVYGSDFFLASSYTTKVDIYEEDPNTTAAWTKAAIDALQIGQKITV